MMIIFPFDAHTHTHTHKTRGRKQKCWKRDTNHFSFLCLVLHRTHPLLFLVIIHVLWMCRVCIIQKEECQKNEKKDAMAKGEKKWIENENKRRQNSEAQAKLCPAVPFFRTVDYARCAVYIILSSGCCSMHHSYIAHALVVRVTPNQDRATFPLVSVPLVQLEPE